MCPPLEETLPLQAVRCDDLCDRFCSVKVKYKVENVLVQVINLSIRSRPDTYMHVDYSD